MKPTLIALILVLTACTKNKCVECTEVVTLGNNDPVTQTDYQCELSKREARDMEGTTTTTEAVGNTTFTRVRTCKEK